MTPGEEDDRPPRQGTRVVVMALLAMALVVASTATALAAGVLLQVDGFKPKPDAGHPRTRGSPRRSRASRRRSCCSAPTAADRQEGRRAARSDTMMLVRLDPEQKATAVLSIPRDLRSTSPGHGRPRSTTPTRSAGRRTSRSRRSSS